MEQKQNSFGDNTNPEPYQPTEQELQQGREMDAAYQRKQAAKLKEQQDYEKHAKKLEQIYNECVNTRGKVYCTGDSVPTPEKESLLDKAKKQVDQGYEKLKEEGAEIQQRAREEIAKHMGPRDKLGGGQAATDAPNAVRPGGGTVGWSVGYKAGDPPPIPNPTNNPQIDAYNEALKRAKPETGGKIQIGEPCTDEEVGVGSGWIGKLKTGFEKAIKKKGVKITGHFEAGADGNLVCVDSSKAGKGAAGAVVNTVENAEFGEAGRRYSDETARKREKEHGL